MTLSDLSLNSATNTHFLQAAQMTGIKSSSSHLQSEDKSAVMTHGTGSITDNSRLNSGNQDQLSSEN